MNKARIGFLGAGWIGRNRMAAIAESGCAEISAVADEDAKALDAALTVHPHAASAEGLEDLLGLDIDGIVIATPSALHAPQSMAALSAGKAVFCQKPLGRNADETRRVVETAKDANRLLGVDLCYRHTAGIEAIREQIAAGDIGKVYAADLVFHNAYGPDKPWYYQKSESGGGCVMDLGIHLVDLALWVLGCPEITGVSSRLYAGGNPLNGSAGAVEDYAAARLDLSCGTVVNLACSWRLPAGRDAVISAVFYGTGGGLSFKNVNGSFYDFKAERFDGTQSEILHEGPDAWGGRAALCWIRQLSESSRYCGAIESILPVAQALDAIYG